MISPAFKAIFFRNQIINFGFHLQRSGLCQTWKYFFCEMSSKGKAVGESFIEKEGGKLSILADPAAGRIVFLTVNVLGLDDRWGELIMRM